MKDLLSTAAVVSALVGGASAAFVHVLASELHRAPAHSETPSEAADPRALGAIAIESDVEALQLEARELRSRLERLEDRADLDARAGVLPSTKVLAEEVAAALADPEGGLQRAPAEVQREVARALDSIRAEERAQAESRRHARELERIEERLVDLRERLELTPAQEADLRALLLAELETQAELDRLRDEGGSRDAVRQLRNDRRSAERSELERILSPEQLEAYERRDARRGNGARGR